ncbi:hypothetical protein ACHAXT_006101 [Thalassiosira profunda]
MHDACSSHNSRGAALHLTLSIAMTPLSLPTAFLPPIVGALRPSAAASASAVSLSSAVDAASSLSSSAQLLAATTAADDALSAVDAASSLSSSARVIATTTTTAADDARVFEAVAPDTSLLVGFGAVVILCVIAGSVWANSVVPVSRTKLAISKSRGEVREYLDGLKASDAAVDDIDATTALEMDGQTVDTSVESVEQPNVGDGRDFERWLFSDWLNKPDAKGGRQKEPALPILREAKWNSGDNPVLVTAAIMMVGIVLASITERVAT